MTLRVGCDIVSISTFQERLNETGDLLPDRIFHPSERTGASAETLAGLFAAKESVFKALGMTAGAWQQLCIDHDTTGAPVVCFMEPKPWVKEITLSISHNDDYAFAVVAAIVE